MSFFKSLGRLFKPLEQIVKPFVKPFVATLPGGAAILQASSSYNAARSAASTANNPYTMGFPGAGSVFVPSLGTSVQYNNPRTQPMSLFPALLGAGRAVMPGVGAAVGTVGRVARRYGGTAAGVATAGAILYDAAGNPVRRKRPRSKGITARELKSFTRVTGILNKYCKTPAPTKRRNAPRGKSCR